MLTPEHDRLVAVAVVYQAVPKRFHKFIGTNGWERLAKATEEDRQQLAQILTDFKENDPDTWAHATGTAAQ